MNELAQPDAKFGPSANNTAVSVRRFAAGHQLAAWHGQVYKAGVHPPPECPVYAGILQARRPAATFVALGLRPSTGIWLPATRHFLRRVVVSINRGKWGYVRHWNI